MPALQAFQPSIAMPSTWTSPAHLTSGSAPYRPAVPLGERELPPGIAALLEDGEKDHQTEDPAPARRTRRGPLRPAKVIPPSGKLALSKCLTVASALQGYGFSRWQARRDSRFDRRIAGKLLVEALTALGGENTEYGSEFMRRCAMIDEFIDQLEMARDAMLWKYPKQHALLIEEEVGKMLQYSVQTLGTGFQIQKDMVGRLERAIVCRIDRITGSTMRKLWSYIRC
ncbi:hypothetical protein GT347_19325 [Xylophilus rhododendri]|uniref:Uncharacterized protein n=1 Tax=Xylophilus rhododendri TaxID=2697032 RepID=A0A857J7D2_9BURK|nr:hypothetical protein [Xylophilus rhododendri]QHI99940.1 hypothetical protein GT347_19325 [Xylophilus rhododendri]